MSADYPAEYRDLQGLIFQNADARQYYNELPKQIRDQLKPHSKNINSFEVLQEYVENLGGEKIG